MTSLTFDIPVQERQPRPVMASNDTAAGTEEKGEGQRFPRLARVLEEARLAERAASDMTHRTKPRFRRLEKAIVSRRTEASGLHAAAIQDGPDKGAAPWQSWLRMLSTCSVAVVAGVAVAVVGGALIAQLAATSPVGGHEASTRNLPLSTVNDQMRAMWDVPPPPRGNRYELRARKSGEVGGVTQHVASQYPALAPKLTGFLGKHHRREAIEAPVAQHSVRLATRPDDAHEHRSVAPRLAAMEPPSTRPTVVTEDAESLPHDALSSLSAYDDGYALQRQGRYLEALVSYQMAVELKPELPHALYNMGAVLIKLGRLEEAATAFERAAALDQSNPFVFYDWGWALEQAGQVDMAIEKYQLAIAIDAASSAGTNAYKRLGILRR